MKIDFLTEKQALENKLEVCKATDFAILLGGYAPEGEISWWTKTLENNRAVVINKNNKKITVNPKWDQYGIRPVLDYDEIKEQSRKINDNEITFGSYPQFVVGVLDEIALESFYQEGTLKKLNNVYNINDSYMNSKIEIHSIPTYEYMGSKFVRIMGNLKNEGSILSNGKIVICGKPYWVKVKPLTFILKDNLAISKYAISSGTPFQLGSYSENIEAKEFENSDLKKLLDNTMANDITQDIEYEPITLKRRFL